MQVARLEYDRQIVATHHGYNILARDWEPREGIFCRYFYVQLDGEKCSTGYDTLPHAKAACTKLHNSGKAKFDYMS